MVSASDISPPAPSPWNARNAASWYIDCAIVHSSEPTTKIEIAAMKKGLRPNISDNLPYSGVARVAVIR